MPHYTETDTEELLGWPRDETSGLEVFLPAIGNGSLRESVNWHPAKEAVAFSILQTRRATTGGFGSIDSAYANWGAPDS